VSARERCSAKALKNCKVGESYSRLDPDRKLAEMDSSNLCWASVPIGLAESLKAYAYGQEYPGENTAAKQVDQRPAGETCLAIL
jgi:hypothetical protein